MTPMRMIVWVAEDPERTSAGTVAEDIENVYNGWAQATGAARINVDVASAAWVGDYPDDG
jgi:hypothetical protein